MRKITLLTLLVVAIVAVPAGAATKTITYKGKATNAEKDFNYGKVTVKRKGAKLTFIQIEAVTATCSGQNLLRTIVFRDGNKDHKIISGSNKIKSNKVKFTFLPVADIEDAEASIEVKFSGSKATGRFMEEGLCSDEGVFTAKK